MELDIKHEQTADGSSTLYIPHLDEHYHSVNGAIQESVHVFIDAGLNKILETAKPKYTVLEIGFGTGLNALLTLIESERRNQKIKYIGIELYPLGSEIIEELNYASLLDTANTKNFTELHGVEWGRRYSITPQFSFLKINEDFTRLTFNPENASYDLIYFDAFAPDKQAEMWSQDIFNYLYSITNDGGILTTYCAKGVVRRMMQNAGYSVERLPGPPGKREMLRATKLQ